MEYVHTQKFLRNTPRKLRDVVFMVKGLSPEKAVEALSMVNKRAARTLSKAISTALSNVKEKGVEGEVLFKEIQVNEGPVLKRWKAGARGRGKPYKKRMSHIRIVLKTKEESVKKQVKTKKKAEKTNVKDKKTAKTKKGVKK